MRYWLVQTHADRETESRQTDRQTAGALAVSTLTVPALIGEYNLVRVWHQSGKVT